MLVQIINKDIRIFGEEEVGLRRRREIAKNFHKFEFGTLGTPIGRVRHRDGVPNKKIRPFPLS